MAFQLRALQLPLPPVSSKECRTSTSFRVMATAIKGDDFPSFLPKEVREIRDPSARSFARRIQRLPVKVLLSFCVRRSVPFSVHSFQFVWILNKVSVHWYLLTIWVVKRKSKQVMGRVIYVHLCLSIALFTHILLKRCWHSFLSCDFYQFRCKIRR